MFTTKEYEALELMHIDVFTLKHSCSVVSYRFYDQDSDKALGYFSPNPLVTIEGCNAAKQWVASAHAGYLQAIKHPMFQRFNVLEAA